MTNPGSATPAVTIGASVAANPYASVPVVPEPTTAGHRSGTTFYPGLFSSQINISGSSTYTFEPGIYYLDDGLKMEGTANIDGHGVLIYINDGRVDFGGDPHRIHLTPLGSSDDPTGEYKDIVLYQAPTNSNQLEYGDQTRAGTVSGNSCTIDHSSGGFEGGVYIPGATLKMRGTTTLCSTKPIVVSRINQEGSSVLYGDAADYSAAGTPTFDLVD